MTRQELHSALDGLVSAWAAAACVWKAGWSLGDYRFVVFSIDVAPKTHVYVQLWSEPLEPVYWEVSSGRWNPPADKWLAGERSDRISAFGFEIGGRAENFQKEVPIQSRAELTSVARTIVDILYAGFDYRGTARLDAQICYRSRATMRQVLSSFTPEDVAKVFARHGYVLVDDNHDEDAPVLQFRIRGILTTVRFGDMIPDHHLFETAVLTCAFPAMVGGAALAGSSTSTDQAAPDDEVRNVEIGAALHFTGGVTAEWLSERVAAWTAMIVAYQREIRRHKRTGRKGVKGIVQ
jgi:hypothetical protein